MWAFRLSYHESLTDHKQSGGFIIAIEIMQFVMKKWPNVNTCQAQRSSHNHSQARTLRCSIYFCLSMILVPHQNLLQLSNLPEESTVCQHYSIFLLFTVRDGFRYCYGGLDSRKNDSPKLYVFALCLLSPEDKAPLS